MAEDDCVICMEIILSTKMNYVKTACGHEFHTSCLLANIAHNGQNCFHCPSCRTIMAKKQEQGSNLILGLSLRPQSQADEENDDDSFEARTVINDDDVGDNFITNDPDYSLRGMRFLFARVEEGQVSEDLQPEINNYEDTQIEEEAVQRNSSATQRRKFLPPANLLATYLMERGISYEDLVKALLHANDEDYCDYDYSYGMTFGRVFGKMVARKKQYRCEEVLRQLSLIPNPLNNDNISL